MAKHKHKKKFITEIIVVICPVCGGKDCDRHQQVAAFAALSTEGADAEAGGQTKDSASAVTALPRS